MLIGACVRLPTACTVSLVCCSLTDEIDEAKEEGLIH